MEHSEQQRPEESIPKRPVGPPFAVRLWENLYGQQSKVETRKENPLKRDIFQLFQLGESLRDCLLLLEVLIEDEPENVEHFRKYKNEETERLAVIEEEEVVEEKMEEETVQISCGGEKHERRPSNSRIVEKRVSRLYFRKQRLPSLSPFKFVKSNLLPKRKPRKVASFALESVASTQKQRRRSWTPQAAFETLRGIM
eukprot:CAMPEP_0184019000 /NCGR_PEP_ID=MMETSP0954-20121128/8495_1 /TAXON_ID=627963 /ORGANISM="Aplanochytrium sp, Strain PBS07" /LENGTH=196 /DNA_ID=CAMNT_0026300591 /DNA_START=391 /DNA_END=981 /DNA_ORIENTATION=+